MLRKIRCLSLIFLIFYVSLAEAQSGKKTVDLDTELGEAGEKEDKSNIEDKEIVVEGEDAQLVNSGKKTGAGVVPEFRSGFEWNRDPDPIVRKDKQGTKETEKAAQIRSRYGTYNSFGLDIYLTKKDKDGIYLLDYSRYKTDSEGFGRNTVSNSESSRDDLTLVSGFQFSPLYKLLFKLNYLDTYQALQSNVNYDNRFKRGAVFEALNQIRPSESQKLDLSLRGTYSDSTLTTLTPPNKSAYYSSGEFQYNWQYIWSERNSLNVGGKIWYGEDEVFETTERRFYRAGDFAIWDIFPVINRPQQGDSGGWRLDMTAGAKVFFAQNNKPIPGPLFRIDSFLPSLHTRLEFERTAAIPDYFNFFLRPRYVKPVHFTLPESKWQGTLSNRLSVSKDFVLKLVNSFSYYETFHEKQLQTDGLYSYNPTEFRISENTLSAEHNITDLFFYEISVFGNYMVDTKQLEPIWGGALSTHFTPSGWDFSLTSRYTGERHYYGSLLKGYFLLGAGIERDINKTIRFFVNGENLLNEAYQVFPGYAESGWKIFGGLNFLL